ncbi:hypothetical protein DESC_480288 [Desulfosarcina cetonica]|nr:hypothetical protein DESC_480288 [Desulfosarcina cetonica]
MEGDSWTVLLQGLAQERQFDARHGAQQPGGEIVQTDADLAIRGHCHPGMAAVQIDALGNPEAVDRLHVDRFQHRVNQELILKVLVEFTGAAQIVVGAGAKRDAALEGMHAGSTVGR